MPAVFWWTDDVQRLLSESAWSASISSIWGLVSYSPQCPTGKPNWIVSICLLVLEQFLFPANYSVWAGSCVPAWSQCHHLSIYYNCTQGASGSSHKWTPSVSLSSLQLSRGTSSMYSNALIITIPSNNSQSFDLCDIQAAQGIPHPFLTSKGLNASFLHLTWAPDW
jgi:hypothetical protein